jgi:hypothetical protein
MPVFTAVFDRIASRSASVAVGRGRSCMACSAIDTEIASTSVAPARIATP